MNTTIGSAASVAITFVVTLSLNAALNYYTSDKGAVSISSQVRLGSTSVSVVTIENQSEDFLSGLVLEVPTGLTVTSITTDPAMVIEEVPSAVKGTTKLLKLSQIRPRHVSRMFVPLPETAAPGSLRLANLEAAGLSLRMDDRLDSPLRNALFSAFFVALLYAAVEAISAYILSRRQKELSKKADELTEKHDAASTEWKKARESIEKDVDRLRTLLSKQRLLLQARLNDYSKELSFWRNAVRTLLLQSGANSEVGESLVERVTSELKTFGTRAETEKHFETLRIAGRWLGKR